MKLLLNITTTYETSTQHYYDLETSTQQYYDLETSLKKLLKRMGLI